MSLRSIVVCAVIAMPAVAHADLTALIPQLTNPIEIAAARANQATYDLLTTGQTPTCDPQLRVDPGVGACTGTTFLVFDRARHLVHTANQLTGGGPTTFSLNVDRARLGRALRWTAAEELAAQGTSATRFAGNQLNSLASRLSALRFGARRSGGGASSDEIGIAKRWGGFIDGSAGNGRQDDTTNLATPGSEDAFDFDGVDLTGGFDYRLSAGSVVGLMLGYTDRSIEFDSSVSVVDATIDSQGESAMLYAMWEGDRLYASVSVGVQQLDHDMRRRIAYASLNPLVASIDETTRSSTDSTSLLASVNVGYHWQLGGFALEPYLRGELQDIRIDRFSERGGDGFDFAYGGQSIESFDAAAGIRMQYVFTPSFGVVIPFLRGEVHKDLADDARSIDAVYAGIVDTTGFGGAQNFDVRTNEPDDEFYIGAAGVSLVFKHGIQAFLQYQQTFALDRIEDRTIAGGLRFEF